MQKSANSIITKVGLYMIGHGTEKNILKLRLFEILNKELQEQEILMKLKKQKKSQLLNFPSRDIPHSLGRKAEISK